MKKILLTLLLVVAAGLSIAQYVPMSVNTNTGYVSTTALRPGTNLNIGTVVIQNIVSTNGETNAVSAITNKFTGANTTGLVSSTISDTNSYLRGDGVWSDSLVVASNSLQSQLISTSNQVGSISNQIGSISNQVGSLTTATNDFVKTTDDRSMTWQAATLRVRDGVDTNEPATVGQLGRAIGGVSVFYASTNRNLNVESFYDARTYAPTHTQSVIKVTGLTNGMYLAGWISNTGMAGTVRQGIADITSKQRITSTVGGRFAWTKAELYKWLGTNNYPELFENSQSNNLTSTFVEYNNQIECSTNVYFDPTNRYLVRWKCINQNNNPDWEFVCGTGLVIAVRLPTVGNLDVSAKVLAGTNISVVESTTGTYVNVTADVLTNLYVDFAQGLTNGILYGKTNGTGYVTTYFKTNYSTTGGGDKTYATNCDVAFVASNLTSVTSNATASIFFPSNNVWTGTNTYSSILYAPGRIVSGDFQVGNTNSMAQGTYMTNRILGDSVNLAGVQDFGMVDFHNRYTDGSLQGRAAIVARRRIDNYGTALDFYAGKSSSEGGAVANTGIVMSVLGNSNVSIGILNGTNRLDVVGGGAQFSTSIRTTPYDGGVIGQGPGMEMMFVSGRGYVLAYNRTAGTYSNVWIAGSNITLAANNGSATMSLLQNGKVGINWTTPAAMLAIASPDDSVSPAISIRQDNATAYGWDIANDTLANGFLSIRRVEGTATNEVMVFDRSVNRVGIGTNAPAYSLCVTGMVMIGYDAGLYNYKQGNAFIVDFVTNAALQIVDMRDQAINNGGILYLGARYRANNDPVYAYIKANQESASSGQYPIGLQFGTQPHGASAAIQFTIRSDGAIRWTGKSSAPAAIAGGTYYDSGKSNWYWCTNGSTWSIKFN